MTNQKPKIGISFSGGGARATAHIGVIQALNEKGIKADFVTGTSGGAIVGAMYAAGLSVQQMLKFAEEGSLLKLFKAKLPIRGLTSLAYLGKLLNQYIDKDSFEALDIPLTVVASNLLTGHKELINSGKLYEAVMASCAIPLIFKPINIKGQLYVDGGIFDNMPVVPLQSTCDIIIGINLIPISPISITKISSMFSIGMRVFDMQVSHNSQINFPLCDVVIEPEKLSAFGIFNFSAHQELYNIGYEAALSKMEEIESLIEQKNILKGEDESGTADVMKK